MPANHEIKFLEKCRVAPPPDAVADFTLPLTFYDLQFLVNPPTQFVHFYRFRHDSASPQFIISSLKSSLSMALKHFLPLAGNVIYPIDDSGDDDHHRMPEFRYTKGDSVSLTIAESSEDFDYLVGDHQKDSYKFHNLVPQLPEPFVTPCSQVSPVFALQVTVFPNFGLSIGRTFFHLLGDATTFINFMKLWASISKFNGDSSLEQLQSSSSFQPLYDRSVVQDPFHLGRKFLNDIKLHKSYGIPRISNNPTTRSEGEVRATFILHRSDIMKLKSFIVGKNLSTFSMTCALMWTCLSKSLDVVREEKVEEDKRENVCAFINFRQRFDPPIPQNYFGNCVVPCIVGLTHGQLVGNEGLSVAATAIRGAIHKMAHDSKGIMRGNWLPYSHTRTTTALAPGMLVIVGSTQHTVYNHNADYDWGEQVKYENVTVNASAILMLITLSRRFEGALELSFSLPKKRMDAFTTIFTNCIDNLHMRSPL